MFFFSGAFTFDVGADGFIRGEGCCAVHLAAENDGERAAGERSLAVLLGSCANQDMETYCTDLLMNSEV